MAGRDNRTSDRIPASLRIRLKYTDEDTFVEKYSVNISRGGIFIATRVPKPVGTSLRFEFQLAHGEALIRGEGSVIWVKPFDPFHPEKPHGMGVRFSKLDEESQHVIERALAWKESRVQRRRGKEPIPPGADPTRVDAEALREDTKRVSLIGAIARAQDDDFGGRGDEPSPAEELFGRAARGDIEPPITIEIEAEEPSEEERLSYSSPEIRLDVAAAQGEGERVEEAPVFAEPDPAEAMAAAPPAESFDGDPTPVVDTPHAVPGDERIEAFEGASTPVVASEIPRAPLDEEPATPDEERLATLDDAPAADQGAARCSDGDDGRSATLDDEATAAVDQDAAPVFVDPERTAPAHAEYPLTDLPTAVGAVDGATLAAMRPQPSRAGVESTATTNGSHPIAPAKDRLPGLDEALAWLATVPARPALDGDPLPALAAEWDLPLDRIEAALARLVARRRGERSAGRASDVEAELERLLDPPRPEPLPTPALARELVAQMLAGHASTEAADSAVENRVEHDPEGPRKSSR